MIVKLDEIVRRLYEILSEFQALGSGLLQINDNHCEILSCS